MTDKHIIIDGVDVNECEYFGTTLSSMKNCTMDSEYLHACRGCNCYYKQLKRKEQECEQEKTLKEMYFTYYKAKHSDIKGNFFRYRQTLIEIKDFVENEMIPNGDTHIILQIISEVEL